MVIPEQSFESLVSRLFRDRIQRCLGLVDLVIRIRHHVGGGHGLSHAGERFIGLVAEDITKVGDCRIQLGITRTRKISCGEPADDRSLFVVPEPIQ